MTERVKKISAFIPALLLSVAFSIVVASMLYAAEGGSAPSASGPEESEEKEDLDPVVKNIIDEFGAWEDEEAQLVVEGIRERLVAAAGEIPEDKEIRFILLDEDSVNAFAMSDGHIFLFRGLIERSETTDQLASVMAHEMTHVLCDHHRKGRDTLTYLQIGAILASIATEEYEPIIAGQMISATLIESYGRESEVEADLSGVELMMDAGFDPIAMIEFFTYMEGLQRRRPQLPGNYFTIHPYPEERIENLREYLESMGIEVPDVIYRLHIALDLICEEIDEHYECTIFVGDEPAFILAGDDEPELIDRGFDVIHRLRDAFNNGLRDHQVYYRERDGTHYIGALGSTIISVTADDEKYLDGDAGEINTSRKEKLKFILWEYYIKMYI